jgi:hypothetical protein
MIKAQSRICFHLLSYILNLISVKNLLLWHILHLINVKNPLFQSINFLKQKPHFTGKFGTERQILMENSGNCLLFSLLPGKLKLRQVRLWLHPAPFFNSLLAEDDRQRGDHQFQSVAEQSDCIYRMHRGSVCGKCTRMVDLAVKEVHPVK